MTENINITFMCAYCAGEVDLDGEDARQVVLVGPENQEQVWFCHFDCFKNALHEDARYFPGDAADEE